MYFSSNADQPDFSVALSGVHGLTLRERGNNLKVSVIVPCFNEVSTISHLLDAIRCQTFPIGEVEVIIADGMSTDGTRERIHAFNRKYPELRVVIIDNPERNIPSALNRAIAATVGTFIIRLDAHSIPNSDYIERCVEMLEGTDIANVGGIWEIKPGGAGWVARGIAVAAGHPLGAGGARYRIGGKRGPVDTVPFGAFRRSWLERVGLYDETLLTNEDYEYNVRLRDAGGEVFFDPSIRSTYLSKSSLRELSRQYSRYGFWKAHMLKRYPGTVRIRQLLPPLFVLSLVLLLLLSPFSAIMGTLLAVELGAYLLVTLFAACVQAWKRKDLSLIVSFPLAVGTMHLSWGSAFLAGAIRASFGRRDAER